MSNPKPLLMRALCNVPHSWWNVACLVLLLLLPTSGWAGNGVGRFIKKVGEYIDSATVRGIDTTYIQVPEKPWQVMLRGNANEMTLDIESMFADDEMRYNWGTDSGTGVGTSLGAWVGYRGYGLGYLFTVGRQKGSNFTIGMGGSNYNVNFRLRRFDTSDADARFTGFFPQNDQANIDEHGHIDLDEPIKVKSMMLEGYYMFNGKHFSNTAGYDQSTIQVRSAGSFIVGASWMSTDIDYAENMNTFLVMMMDDVGRIKVDQVNVGVGYAYNFVPAHQWLVNVMFMPSVAIYNRLKLWKYDYDFDHDDQDIINLQGVESSHSRMKVNLRSWLTLVYNSKRWYAMARGQWCNSRFERNGTSGQLKDWFFNVGLGVRF